MIKLSKSHLKRVISSALACTMTATMLHCFPDKHFLVNAEETNQKYPYTMFAASSNEGAITVNANNFCVNGNVATNGTIVSSGNTNINGTRTEQAAEEMLYIFDKIDSKYFTGSNVEEYTEDYTLEEMNININNPVEVEGGATLTGNININSALKALENVELYGEVKNTNDSLIFSKYGDIIIESQNVNLNGLVYAPFGDVVVTAQNLNLNNVVIIADTITFDCPSVNANYSNSVSTFVGNISDRLYIPSYEFGYLSDTNDNDLPDLFENYRNWEDMLDTDGDRLPDSIEEYITTNKNLLDTDNDKLSDYYEVFATLTSPIKTDSDSNGISDSNEDFDLDNLTNEEEYIVGTDPRCIDTDKDTLNDYDEYIVYHTNPLEVDTDFDGLEDADEIYLGTDPILLDTDGDGILDCDEKFNQTFTHIVDNENCAVEEVIVSMEGTGNLQTNTIIESVMDKDVICSEVVGLIGEPFSIETTSDFGTATLSFKIDQTRLGNTDFNALLFLWYDEENYEFVEMETSHDAINSIVSITTTHFSRYMVVDKNQWYEAWAQQFNYNPGKTESHAPTIKYNTVLAIDCSGSMNGYDPITNNPVSSEFDGKYYARSCQRIKSAQEFINNMNKDDRSGIVLFDSNANIITPMTNDLYSLRLGLQSVYSSGGTNFYSALIEAYNAFEEESIGALYTNNRIILLSDGEDGSYSSTLSLLHSIYDENSTDKRRSIKIFTIGLGSSYDSRLEEIATISHGEFFKAYTADDLVNIYTEIGIGGDFDTTDTDGDGLYDAVEAAGIRIQNGTIISGCDPTIKDTDKDGLEDGEEIDPTIRCKKIYWSAPEININNKSYYFFKNSMPDNEDSDGDGLLDGKPVFYDDKPLAPADPEPSLYTSNKNLWNMHIKEILSNYNTAEKYSNNYYETEELEFEFKFTDTFIPVPYFDNNLIEVLFSSVSTLGSVALDFRYDDKHIALHSDTTQWQAIGGYNDFYDWVFDTATSMSKLKLDFESNNKNYVIWSWKGNYLNLGAGAEVGFYTQNSVLESIDEFTGLEQWMIEDELPMTLSLYKVNSNGLVIDSYYHWMPDEEQWWITGFVPNIYDYSVKEDELVQIASVDFSKKPQLLESLFSEYRYKRESSSLIFDMEDNILWLIW